MYSSLWHKLVSIVLLSYDYLLYVLLSIDAISGEGSSYFPEHMSTGFSFVVVILYFMCTVFSSYVTPCQFVLLPLFCRFVLTLDLRTFWFHISTALMLGF